MKCHAWRVERPRKKGKPRTVTVGDAYVRRVPKWDDGSPPTWEEVTLNPTPPEAGAVLCGGELQVIVSVDSGGCGCCSEGPSLEVVVRCRVCRHDYHGPDLARLSEVDDLAKLLEKHIEEMPNLIQWGA